MERMSISLKPLRTSFEMKTLHLRLIKKVTSADQVHVPLLPLSLKIHGAHTRLIGSCFEMFQCWLVLHLLKSHI